MFYNKYNSTVVCREIEMSTEGKKNQTVRDNPTLRNIKI